MTQGQSQALGQTAEMDEAPDTGMPRDADIPSGGVEVKKQIDVTDEAADRADLALSETPDMQAMLELRADLVPEKQMEGLALLQSQLIALIARMKKANPDLKLKRSDGRPGLLPGELMERAAIQGVEVKPSENLAWQKYMQLVGQPGNTSSYLARTWGGDGGVLEQARDASEGIGAKFRRSLAEHPFRTIGYALVGAAGVYVGFKVLKGIWNWATKEEQTASDGQPVKDNRGFWERVKAGAPSGKTMAALAVLAAGAIIGRKGLKELLMGMSKDEMDELVRRGESLPAKVREELAQARAEIQELRDQAAAAKGKAVEVALKAQETLNDPVVRRAALIKALIGIYAVDQIELADTLKNDMALAFITLGPKKVGDIAETDGDSEAVRHTCRLIKKTRDQYQKMVPGKALDDMKLVDFLDHLSADPAYSLHHDFIKKMGELDLSALTNPSKIGDLFNGDFIETTIESKRDEYIEILAARFEMTVPAEERTDFLKAVGSMFMGANLSWSMEQMATHIAVTHPSEKAKALALTFFERIRKETEANLPHVVERYDIERTDDQDLNHLLRRNLTFNRLTFADGLELSLLFGGTHPEGGLGQTKDVAMLILISKILKHIDEDVQVKYLANVADLITGNLHAFNLNLPWKQLQPYFGYMVKQMVERAKRKVKHGAEAALAMRLPSESKDFQEKLKNADWLEFGMTFAKEAGAGSIRIPKELYLTLKDNWGDLLNDATNGSTLLKLLLATGGTIFYSKGEHGENLGVLYLAGKYYFLKPMGIMWDAMTGAFSGVAMKTYFVESAPYMAIGAGAAFLTAHGNIGTKVAAFLRGAARGAMAPVTLPVAGYRAIRSGHWNVERMSNIVAARWNTTGHVPLLQKSSAMFEHYWEMVQSPSASSLDKFEAILDEPFRQGKMSLYQDVYHAYARQWATWFIRDYYHFFGINPLTKGGLGSFDDIQLKTGEASELNEALKVAKRMRQFTEELKAIPDLDDIKPAKFIEYLEKMTHLESFELENLKAQAHDPEKFARLRNMINAAKKEGAIGKVAQAGREWLHDRKWYRDFEKWRGTKFGVKEMNALAQMDNADEIAKLLKEKGVLPAAAQEMSEKIAAMSRSPITKEGKTVASAADVAEVERLIKEVAHDANITVKFSPELGRLWKAIRFGGKALNFAGAAVYGFQAISAYHEAGKTSNDERRSILLTKGGFYTVATLAEAGVTYAVMTAGATVGIAAGSLAAFAIAPITYMSDKTFESMEESTKSAEEWSETEHRQLIHDWISTHAYGAGDAYRLWKNQKEIGREKQETIKRIAKAVLVQEENRPADSEPNPDRMHYLEAACHFRPPANYNEALTFLRDSQSYAELMATRREQLEIKKQNPAHRYEIGGVDALDPRFENPDAAGIGRLLNAFRTNALAHIPEELKTNFDAFSDHYLIDLFCQSWSATRSKQEEALDISDQEESFAIELRSYLTHVRHINTETEYRMWLAKEDHGTLQSARKRMAQFMENPAELLKEDLKRRSGSAALNAVYDLAKFFGYTGQPTEDSFRQFFDEDHGGAFGMYWDGKRWYANREGMDFDTEAGPALNETAVQKIIASWRQDPDNVIETRQDSMVDIISLHQFEDQVNQMASILEKGLQKKTSPAKPLEPAMPLAA